MYFVRRDGVLLAGTICMIIGLIPFISPIYSILIGIGIFFGIKTFVQKRKKSMAQEIGEGFCAVCGEKIINNQCPSCNKSEKSE